MLSFRFKTRAALSRVTRVIEGFTGSSRYDNLSKIKNYFAGTTTTITDIKDGKSIFQGVCFAFFSRSTRTSATASKMSIQLSNRKVVKCLALVYSG